MKARAALDGCKKSRKHRDFFYSYITVFPVYHIACQYKAACILVSEHFQYSVADILYITVPVSITKHVSVNYSICQYNTTFIRQHVSAYHSVYQYNTALISISQRLSV